MRIDAIKNGIVIDHIPAEKCMDLYKYLNLDNLNCTIAIIKNVPSNKYGKKDIIKISEELDVNLDVIGYVDPRITVNIIKDGVIVEKRRPELPEKIVDVIKCKNPRCITSIEQEIQHEFRLTDREKKIYRCVYCEAKAK